MSARRLLQFPAGEGSICSARRHATPSVPPGDMPLRLFRQETCHSVCSARRHAAPSVPPGDMPLHLFRQETCRSICSARRHPAPSAPHGDTPLHLFRQETPRTLGNTCPALTGGPGGHPRPFRVVDYHSSHVQPAILTSLVTPACLLLLHHSPCQPAASPHQPLLRPPPVHDRPNGLSPSPRNTTVRESPI